MKFGLPIQHTLDSIVSEHSEKSFSTKALSGSGTLQPIDMQATTRGSADPKVSDTEDKRMLLDVHIAAPTIVIPLSAKSTHVFMVDLGTITVTSQVSACKQQEHFSTDPSLLNRDITQALVYNHCFINISGATVTRAEVDSSCQTEDFARECRPLMALDDTSVELMLLACTYDSFDHAVKKSSVLSLPFCSESRLVKEAAPSQFVLQQEAAETMLAVKLGVSQLTVGQTDVGMFLEFFRVIPEISHMVHEINSTFDQSNEEDEVVSVSSYESEASDTEEFLGISCVSETERLDHPTSSTCYCIAQWEAFELTLYLDRDKSFAECRDDAWKLAQLSVCNIQGGLASGATGRSSLRTILTVDDVQVHHILIRKQAHSLNKKANSGNLVVSKTNRIAKPLLEVNFKHHRHTILIIGTAELDIDAVVAIFELLFPLHAIYVQQNSPRNTKVAIAWTSCYADVISGVKAVGNRSLTGLKWVGAGPALDSKAHCTIRSFACNVSSDLIRDILEFIMGISFDGLHEDTADKCAITVDSQSIPHSSSIAQVSINPAYVSNILDKDAITQLVPTPNESLKVDINVEHPTIILFENLQPRARQFILDFILKCQITVVHGIQSTNLELRQLLITSREGYDQSTRLDCVVPFDLLISHQQEIDNTVIAVNVDPVNINLVYADVRTAINFITMLQKEYMRLTRLEPSHSWTQKSSPLTGLEHVPQHMKPVEATSSIVAPVIHRENMSFNLPSVNVMLIETKGGLRMPLLCLSVRCLGTVQNWTNAIAATAQLQLALAAIDPKHSSWEPILLRENDVLEDVDSRPYTLNLKYVHIYTAFVHIFQPPQCCPIL